MIHPTEHPIYINSFQSYKLYLILVNAFKKGYDPVKYSWKIRVSQNSFEKRKDKYFFEKIQKSFDIFEQQKIFMVNLLANQDQWIGDMLNQDQIMFYRKYMSRFNDLSILFKEDLQNLILFCKSKGRMFKSLFLIEDNKEPMIFKLLQNDSIQYETFILLDSYFNIIEMLDESKNFIWDQYSVRIKAYKNLFVIDKLEVIKILKESLKLYQ